jgi:hypothetical protein
MPHVVYPPANIRLNVVEPLTRTKVFEQLALYSGACGSRHTDVTVSTPSCL